jgi:hypothetical protein
MTCDCRWCSICGRPVMDGVVIVGYCQLRRGHDGEHGLDLEGDTP